MTVVCQGLIKIPMTGVCQGLTKIPHDCVVHQGLTKIPHDCVVWQGLTKLLLELVEATELDVQKEIISALPSVVDDSDHSNVASKLKSVIVPSLQLVRSYF